MTGILCLLSDFHDTTTLTGDKMGSDSSAATKTKKQAMASPEAMLVQLQQQTLTAVNHFTNSGDCQHLGEGDCTACAET